MLEAKEVNFAYLRGQPVLNDIDIKIVSTLKLKAANSWRFWGTTAAAKQR